MALQRVEFNPDIEIKFHHLISHMSEKNKTIEQFIQILKEICDSELFYARNLDKFANSISKLMMGKDPLKDVFIIFERLISAKSEQSMILANSIKDDMIPFIEKESIDAKQQNQLHKQARNVRDIRLNMETKIKSFHSAEFTYRRAFQLVKKHQTADTRQAIQERDHHRKVFAEKQSNLIENISSYNHSVEEYLLEYTRICEKLSTIETNRKKSVRDSVNKYMIFEMNNIKNIEYNIPRYMKSLEKMEEKLIIQDKIDFTLENTDILQLARVSVNNYVTHLSQQENIEIPSIHKQIMQIKKYTQKLITTQKYHLIMEQLNHFLNQADSLKDIRVLKEIVYFSRNVEANLFSYNKLNNAENDKDINDEKKDINLSLFDAVLCHKIFKNLEFWEKYQLKLSAIIQKQSKSVNLMNGRNNQSDQVRINLNFLAADIEFLKMVSFHALPAKILSNFTMISNDSEKKIKVKSQAEVEQEEFISFMSDIDKYI